MTSCPEAQAHSIPGSPPMIGSKKQNKMKVLEKSRFKPDGDSLACVTLHGPFMLENQIFPHSNLKDRD